MKAGDLVKVETKHYGIELGVLVKRLRLRDEHWQVKMFNDIFPTHCIFQLGKREDSIHEDNASKIWGKWSYHRFCCKIYDLIR